MWGVWGVWGVGGGERYVRGLPRVVRRALANLPTCREVGESAGCGGYRGDVLAALGLPGGKRKGCGERGQRVFGLPRGKTASAGKRWAGPGPGALPCQQGAGCSGGPGAGRPGGAGCSPAAGAGGAGAGRRGEVNSQCSDFIVQSLHCAIRSGGRVSGGMGSPGVLAPGNGRAGPDKPAGRGISPGADASTEKEERVGAVYPGVNGEGGL